MGRFFILFFQVEIHFHFVHQVNTGGEDTKSGVAHEEVSALALQIRTECQSLRIVGLMTIGPPDAGENPPAFEALVKCREGVAAALGIGRGRGEGEGVSIEN